jgi:hypothetical protein
MMVPIETATRDPRFDRDAKRRDAIMNIPRLRASAVVSVRDLTGRVVLEMKREGEA